MFCNEISWNLYANNENGFHLITFLVNIFMFRNKLHGDTNNNISSSLHKKKTISNRQLNLRHTNFYSLPKNLLISEAIYIYIYKAPPLLSQHNSTSTIKQTEILTKKCFTISYIGISIHFNKLFAISEKFINPIYPKWQRKLERLNRREKKTNLYIRTFL